MISPSRQQRTKHSSALSARAIMHVGVRIGVLISAVVVLSSCRVDQSISLKVNPNGTGTVAVTVTADKAIVDAAPDLAADLRVDDLKSAGWKVDGPDTTKEGGLTVRISRSFRTPAEASTILNQLNGERGPVRGLALTREGKDTNSTWRLTGALQVSDGLDAFVDNATRELLGAAPFAADVEEAGLNLGEAIGIDFTVSLPGKVAATTGLQGDNGVTWRVPMDGSTIDVATSVDNVDVAASVARFGRGAIKVVAVLWVVLMLILLVSVFTKNNRATNNRTMNGRKFNQRTPRI